MIHYVDVDVIYSGDSVPFGGELNFYLHKLVPEIVSKKHVIS